MKGIGTDVKTIIEVLCKRSNAQRMVIVKAFKTAYGKNLVDKIHSETSGKLRKLLIALLTPNIEYLAHELHDAITGDGTDTNALFDIMCAASNQEIVEISDVYHKMYRESLEKALQGDTSGNFKRLMISLSAAGRDESTITDVSAAIFDAQELKKAGIDKWGTDEIVFSRILCSRNYKQLELIEQEYYKLTNHTLAQDIKKEFSGDIKTGLLAVLVGRNRPAFYAERLYESMAGLGTNDKSLIRLVVMRHEVDMVDIKKEFFEKYGKTLKSFIQGDTSGDYRNTLYALIGEDGF